MGSFINGLDSTSAISKADSGAEGQSANPAGHPGSSELLEAAEALLELSRGGLPDADMEAASTSSQ